MADVNSVVLVGRLTRDGELKYTNTGLAINRLSIAINKRRKKENEWVEEVNFFNIVIMGKTAEALKPYLLKGKQIAVQGELRQNRWEQNGQQKSTVEIFATNIQLLGGSSGSSGKGPTPKDYSSGDDMPPPPDMPVDDFEDDIPF